MALAPTPTPIPSGDADFQLVWTTKTVPADLNDETDGILRETGLTLNEGSVIRIVDMLPGRQSPMHRTNSIDYGIVLSGWASGSTYPLLGGLRSSAQMISYEIAMGLSFVAVFLYASSMSTSQIVAAQESVWYVVLLLPSFVIYTIAMVGETNRAPFDLPEAEGELVGGFHTEYSSLKFALFFLAEYVNMVTVSAMATTLFLGSILALVVFAPISALTKRLIPLGVSSSRAISRRSRM